MEWNRVETLLNADIDKVASKASNGGAALAALASRIRGEVGSVEAALNALSERLDALPVQLGDARALAARCDAIIAKAEGEGRDDLAAAATARKEKALSDAARFEAELAGGETELERLEDALTRLEEKAADVDLRLGGSGVDLDLGGAGFADTLPAMETLDRPPRDTDPASPSALRATNPAATAVKAPAAAGGDDLDAQFAELLAGMGDLDDPPPGAAASAPDDDDDDLALPDLVDVGDDELPEGADPDAKGPIDFSALDALAAKGSGGPAPKGKAAPPAVKGKAIPAVKGAAKPPATGDGQPRSRKTLWIVVGGAVVAAGGTIAALLAFGVL